MSLNGDEACGEELSPVRPTYKTLRGPSVMRQT